MSGIDCSVVIPTRDRLEQLRLVLEAYVQQTERHFEIIVVDDRSECDMVAGLHDLRTRLCYPLTVMKSDGQGPAYARNMGAGAASGEILLFCGDDCIPTSALIESHLKRYKELPDIGCVQGLTLWHSRVATPFQRFLDDNHYQTDYDQLKAPDGSWKGDAPLFCMTTNFSIKKRIFSECCGFNADFVDACWEDLEFAFRLGQRGVQTAFASMALNFHDHKYDLIAFAGRQVREGRWRPMLCKLWPGASTRLLSRRNYRLALAVDWEMAANARRECVEASRQMTVEVSDEIEQSWKFVLDLATNQGIIQTLLEWGKGWQYMPLLGENIDLPAYITLLNDIEKSPDQGAEDAIDAFSRQAPAWLTLALKSQLDALRGRHAQAQTSLRQALDKHPELGLFARDGRPS